jgi:DNA polymerase III delta prime subunit
MSFKVGDILWVVGRERPGVRVYQVVEELTKKTLSGTITTFKAQSPAPPGKSKKVTVDSLDGAIFTNVNEARKDMLRRTEAAIDKMIQANKNLINKFYNKKDEEDPKEIFRTEENILKGEDERIVTLPDGTEARLKINLGDVL